ncbi:MAG TPA: hypothetical protein ENK09_08320 [Nitrospirae bacterium]|nr:hypothetical protein [Nitrospirota bacterium]
MSLREAHRYIKELHRKQENPYLWPDFLTGLPDRQGILKKLDSVYPKLGQYGVACVRIASIHPYLLKYGYDHHAEIIQWAAAILKTVSSEYRGSFVGTAGTHEFVLIARSSHIFEILKKANSLFKKKTRNYYSEGDIKRGYVISFQSNEGETVRVGFMRLVAAVVTRPVDVEKIDLVPFLSRICNLAEGEGKDIEEFSEETSLK